MTPDFFRYFPNYPHHFDNQMTSKFLDVSIDRFRCNQITFLSN